MKTLPFLFVLPLALSACGGGNEQPATDAQAVRGCLMCHSFDSNGPKRSGPSLYGVYGKAAGSQQGYNYSKAMKNSGIVWSDETLDAFLRQPSAVVPGTRMVFSGEADPAKRRAMIAYLKKKAG